jgi:hypothetical protein
MLSGTVGSGEITVRCQQMCGAVKPGTGFISIGQTTAPCRSTQHTENKTWHRAKWRRACWKCSWRSRSLYRLFRDELQTMLKELSAHVYTPTPEEVVIV